MFASLRRAGLLCELPSDAFEKDWNVDCRPVGSGVRALRYLSAYVFRIAISDKRLVEVTERTVTFAYTDTKTGTDKRMTLTGAEFLRRFLQHVLPSGFMRIRYYGFLHPCSAVPVKLAVALLEAFAGIPARTRPSRETAIPTPVCCPACNGKADLLYYAGPTTSYLPRVLHSGGAVMVATLSVCCRKTFSGTRRLHSRLECGVPAALVPAGENSHQGPISRVLDVHSRQLIPASARRSHTALGPQMPITPQTSIIALHK